MNCAVTSERTGVFVSSLCDEHEWSKVSDTWEETSNPVLKSCDKSPA